MRIGNAVSSLKQKQKRKQKKMAIADCKLWCVWLLEYIYPWLVESVSHRRMKHHTMAMAKSHHTYFVATLSIASPA